MSNPFDEDYYLRGKETGKSNYQDYRWLPDLTLPMADKLRQTLHVTDGDTFLDIGAALGFVVKALRMRGVDAHGYDISEWAVANCDPSVKDCMSTKLSMPSMFWGHVLMKDVAEHIPRDQLRDLLRLVFTNVRKNALIIVPLTAYFGGEYIRPEDNADPTHVIRWTLEDWIWEAQQCAGTHGYVTGSYHYPGLKPASGEVPKSCGFIQFNRV
jgi:hypothetical protein